MKRIAIIAIKGGTGKSTLANELAFSLDRSNIPYSYYDMDGQRGGAHTENEVSDARIMIADTPAAVESRGLKEIAQSADIVVIPTRTGAYEMYSWAETLHTIHQANPDAEIIIVHNAANRYRLSREYHEWLAENAAGAPVYTIPQAEAVPQAQALEKSVITYAPKSKAGQAFKIVVNAIREAAGLPREE